MLRRPTIPLWFSRDVTLTEMGKSLSPPEMRLYRLCDEVLFYVWDPIGVRGQPFARGEYNAYLPRVFELVKADAREELVQYLRDVAQRRMEVAAPDVRAEETVTFLMSGRRWIEMTPDGM